MNSIILFGGGGQLARAIHQIFKVNHQYSIKSLLRSEADITDCHRVTTIIRHHQPSIIINCAAFTDVEHAEQHPEIPFQVNEIGVRNIAIAMQKYSPGTRFIHFSTDYVFSGEDAPEEGYSEDSPSAPVNVYGMSKRRGELVLLDEFPHVSSLIIRLSWLYGEGRSNFISKLLTLASTQPVVRVVSDVKGSPTSTLQVANFLAYFLGERDLRDRMFKEQIIHFSGRGKTSWYEFAKEIKHRYQIPNTLIPVSHTDFPHGARRPLDTYLCTETVHSIIPLIDSWKVALEQFVSSHSPFMGPGSKL